MKDWQVTGRRPPFGGGTATVPLPTIKPMRASPLARLLGVSRSTFYRRLKPRLTPHRNCGPTLFEVTEAMTVIKGVAR